ncbi:MAG: response regulator [Saprospiraceae bacterium]|nr:response regulator [Saprospiraceae bacterium]
MKRILLLEDNKDVRENTAEILELSHYQVKTAENGEHVREHISNFWPDLILCDIMMPMVDGYQVLEQLRRSTPMASIPFIFLTAKSKKSDVRKGMNLGADDYLTKPFTEDELLNAVESRLRKSSFLLSQFSPDISGVNKFFKSASQFLKVKYIEQIYHADPYKKGDFVFMEGDAAHRLFYIEAGTVKTYKSTRTGKELVTGIYRSGDFLGQSSVFSNKSLYAESTFVIENALIYRIPKTDFIHVINQHPEVMRRFLSLISNDLLQTKEDLVVMAYSSVRERAAKALLKLEDSTVIDEGTKPGIRINREDFASMIGTATETAIRTLSDFRQEGLITTDQARRIRVLDRKRLLLVAEFGMVGPAEKVMI